MFLANLSNPKIIFPSIHQCWDGGMRGAIEPDLAGERKALFLICCQNVCICCHLRNLLFFASLYYDLQLFAAVCCHLLQLDASSWYLLVLAAICCYVLLFATICCYLFLLAAVCFY